MASCDPTLRLREVPWAALAGLEEAAVEAIARVLSGQAAERVVDRLLRAHRGLTAPQRTALVAAVFGVGLWRRRLAWHTVSEPTAGCSRLLLFALLHHLGGVDLKLAIELTGLEGNAFLGQCAQPSAAERWSFPDWIIDSFARDFGAVETDQLCATLNIPGPICLRANLLRTTRDGLVERLRAEGVATRPARYSSAGLLVEGARPNILGLRAHQEGLFEVQDEGSQLLGLLVEARPGDTVLDFCAGRGGKTLLLAGAMQNQGTLYAHDVDLSRLGALEKRAARAGVTNLRVLRGPPPERLSCDRVLVDAPCSELGTLRRGPDARFRIIESEARQLPNLQSAILQSAAACVKPGGRLVYATCTLRHEENQAVVEEFLAAHPAFSLLPAGAGWLADELRAGPYLLALPHRHGTDGFFAAVLQAPAASALGAAST